MKPGYKTTEFWITLLVILTSIGLAYVALRWGHTIWGESSSVVFTVIGFMKARAYGISRENIKKLEIFVEQHKGELPQEILSWLGIGSKCDPCQTPIPTIQPVRPQAVFPGLTIITKIGKTKTITKVRPTQDS